MGDLIVIAALGAVWLYLARSAGERPLAHIVGLFGGGDDRRAVLRVPVVGFLAFAAVMSGSGWATQALDNGFVSTWNMAMGGPTERERLMCSMRLQNVKPLTWLRCPYGGKVTRNGKGAKCSLHGRPRKMPTAPKTTVPKTGGLPDFDR